MDIREHFFTERLVTKWNRLCRKVIGAPSLSMSKSHLDNVPNNVPKLLFIPKGRAAGLDGHCKSHPIYVYSPRFLLPIQIQEQRSDFLLGLR